MDRQRECSNELVNLVAVELKEQINEQRNDMGGNGEENCPTKE